MTKLPKEKRNKLILAAMGIVGALGLLYTFILGNQQDKLATYTATITSIKDKLFKAQKLVKNGPDIQEKLDKERKFIAARETQMSPPGQYYIWFFKVLDEFRQTQRLDPSFISDLTQPEFSEAGLLPNFPYKAATFGVKLSGKYAEVGHFIAEFENAFPYMRVQNIRMQPEANKAGVARTDAGAIGAQINERLSVELKVVTLIRPGTT